MENKEDTVLKNIGDDLHHLVSYKQVFLRGLINGIATAIGATFIAGIVLSILTSTLSAVENLPIINIIIESINNQNN